MTANVPDLMEALEESVAARRDRERRLAWGQTAIVSDPRIDHESPVVRAAAEALHGKESMHLHVDVSAPVCVYCAYRASTVVRLLDRLDTTS